MSSDDVVHGHGPRSWAELHAAVAAAAQANLEQAIRVAKSVEIPVPPVPWNAEDATITLPVGSPKGVFWKEEEYFLVDAALDEQRQDNRYVVEYHFYNSKNGLLGLTVPAPAQQGLKDAVKVRAFRVDKTAVALARQSKQAIANMDRGPKALDLWSDHEPTLIPWSPSYLPADRALNSGQQSALAAMTTPGGFFVWGPPGTGKTTVITSAVHRALDAGQSVLVTSHTNVAVDNVLTGLDADSQEYGLDIMRPGQVVRHCGNSTDKVSSAVREHPSLLLDKAAALVTNLQARLQQLDEELRANKGHPDRARERDVLAELHRRAVDVRAIQEARQMETVVLEIDELDSRLPGLDRAIAVHDSDIAEHERQVERFAGLDAELAAVRGEYAGLRDTLQQWTAECERCREEMLRDEHEIDAAKARHEAAQLRVNSWVTRIVPGLVNRHRIVSAEAAALVSELLASHADLGATWKRAQLVVREIESDRQTCVWREAELKQGARERDGYQCRLDKLRQNRRRLNLEADPLRARQLELNRALGNIEVWRETARMMRKSGHWQLVGEYEELLQTVADLDEERKVLEVRMKKLQDEFAETRRELLRTAPVIATTLTALSFNTELAKRRFDVVIVDESASAKAVDLVYAAAKADTTLAIVGDFLQNAPIAEADDARNDQQREVVRWQTSDIFALAGIRDRASAERHPRCTAISKQYRYPPIIAEVVNAFCYGGLLESHQLDTPENYPVITFFDTSALLDLEFSRISGSWRCRRTVGIAADLATIEKEDGATTKSLGYVTPYAPQANAVQNAFRRKELDVEAGTSHRFQGREFDTVIVDLMQDSSPRWISTADLHGNQRAVSAAKLLNVALTRAKKKLYLIGDWRFVKGCESPGMRALAALEERPGFELVHLGV